MTSLLACSGRAAKLPLLSSRKVSPRGASGQWLSSGCPKGPQVGFKQIKPVGGILQVSLFTGGWEGHAGISSLKHQVVPF